MSSSIKRDDDNDSDDAPEEFTAQQGLQQNQEITKAQQQSIASARREVKERRKKWAERLTPRPKPQPKASEGDDEMVEDEPETDASKQSQVTTGMLPSDIVSLLAAREKQVFLSDSEEEPTETKIKRKKKKTNIEGVETVILKNLPPSHCVQNSLEFLKKRKMQVARSSAVLNNSKQALRLLSSSGVLK
ncbi:hypothetical protein KSS87_012853 [Heliosperma pusillum]|nr:hypothetical protein KSS87_012853 [Heliosperma pusillum]